MSTRLESDSLGTRPVPAAAYYGIHTDRALENFPLSGVPISRHPELVHAIVAVKAAAARANRELGLLDARKAEVIERACQEIRTGSLLGDFVVDVLQGGAGTSTNMNANEVVANLALEHLGEPRGAYQHIHPLEHVNLSQSTNDVYPTGVRLATAAGITRLEAAVAELIGVFEAKAREFRSVLKMGRTQLQDAVPMTLGQQLGAYANLLEARRVDLSRASQALLTINLGGTAIGTGINAHPEFGSRACRELTDIVGRDLRLAENLIAASADTGALVNASGAIRSLAVELSKTCNDLRLAASGPAAGLNEINLPALQAGSSIMPGKVNPVIPEVVNQAAFEVMGNDLAVTLAAEAGQFQLNAFEPVIAHKILSSVDVLASACHLLGSRCVSGLTANEAHLSKTVGSSLGIVTALSPYLGYAASAALVHDAQATGRTVGELALATGRIDERQLRVLLDPHRLTMPQLPLAIEDHADRE